MKKEKNAVGIQLNNKLKQFHVRLNTLSSLYIYHNEVYPPENSGPNSKRKTR